MKKNVRNPEQTTATIDTSVRDSKVVTQPPQRKTVEPQEVPAQPQKSETLDRDFSVLGKNVNKKDAYEKVIGKTQFAGDMKRPNMLYGGVFRSKIPAGFIDHLDISKAAAIPSVACVDLKDIPGLNKQVLSLKMSPFLSKIRSVVSVMPFV